jgi:hypothetical protein
MQPKLHPHHKADWNLLHVDADLEAFLGNLHKNSAAPHPEPVLSEV